MTPPSSAPPLFTPPEVTEFLLEEELAQSLINGNDRSSKFHCIIETDQHKNLFSALILFNTETQSEKPNNVNTEQQDGFIINLSKDQKSQYGSQFDANNESEGPGIVGK